MGGMFDSINADFFKLLFEFYCIPLFEIALLVICRVSESTDASFTITCLEIIGGFLRSQKRQPLNKLDAYNKLAFKILYETVVKGTKKVYE